MVVEPYFNYLPTLTGEAGHQDLHRFHRDSSILSDPPSLRIKLFANTIRADRVVAEMFMSSKHTQLMPWLFPDIGPTSKNVEVALVVIACISGEAISRARILGSDQRSPRLSC